MNTTLRSLWQCHQVVLEMLDKRGFYVPAELRQETLVEFMRRLAIHPHDSLLSVRRKLFISTRSRKVVESMRAAGQDIPWPLFKLAQDEPSPHQQPLEDDGDGEGDDGEDIYPVQTESDKVDSDAVGNLVTIAADEALFTDIEVASVGQEWGLTCLPPPHYEQCFPTDRGDTVAVFFDEEPRLRGHKIQFYADLLQRIEIPRCIVVIAENPTHKALSFLASKVHLHGRLRIEHFTEDELLFSPLDHTFNPDYEVMTSAAVKAYLAKRGWTLTVLPRMFVTDAVSRYFGLRKNQVVKEKHLSETAGIMEKPRIVSMSQTLGNDAELRADGKMKADDDDD